MGKDIKLIFRENMNSQINNIKQENPNAKFYSISKVNNFNTCQRGFYYTYINKRDQKQGIYSMLGTSCHSDLESLYENEENTLLDKSNFDNDWKLAEMFGINFPNENIKINYKKDIDTHYQLYKKREGKFISELGFLLNLDGIHYLMGYIDLIEVLDNNKVKIYDFKTSAKFVGDKLLKAGRQLAVYQMALEQLYDMEIVDNGWEMLKYVEVQVGTNKPKIVSAREWVSKCQTQIKTLLKKSGVDSIMADMQLAYCSNINNIDALPEDIRQNIKINTWFLPYQITDEVKAETTKYILDSIKEIESKKNDKEELWLPTVNQFFCKNLCGFSGKHCRYWELE
ncbi:MAG: PD-(D/E)XK nuclease family protein [Clostridium sp.]|uniref:PD-(D/E)XK nuclease family protein n=1 Tax=Clostridium sp. TaxID=1506 RepID=UPI003F2D266B